MPLQTKSLIDNLSRPTDTLSGSPDARYLAIGWGERNFYLNTPTWSDPDWPQPPLQAYGMNQTPFISLLYPAIQENERIVRFNVSREQYRH